MTRVRDLYELGHIEAGVFAEVPADGDRARDFLPRD